MDQNELVERTKFVNAGNVVDELVKRIKDLIVCGSLKAGFRFPNENDFCEQLGVGRSTLREAYKVLESQNCITRTHRGTYVNNLDDFILNLPFDMVIRTTSFHDMLEFRSIFEAEIAGLAAHRATHEHIRNMEEFMEQMRENRGDLMKLTDIDMCFHMEIAQASGNKLLINTMQMAKAVFSRGILEGFQQGGDEMIDQAISYHESLLTAFRQRDVAMAQAVMRVHVMSVVTTVSADSAAAYE